MSGDSEIEEAIHKALDDVFTMIWPKQRERILKDITVRVMGFMKWDKVETKDE